MSFCLLPRKKDQRRFKETYIYINIYNRNLGTENDIFHIQLTGSIKTQQNNPRLREERRKPREKRHVPRSLGNSEAARDIFLSPVIPHPDTNFNSVLRERGVGVVEKHLKVGLVPGTGLGRGLEGIGLAAERVVAVSAGVAGAVGLATGLNPDEGIGELGAGVSRGADTEASTVNVAPV